MLSISNGLPIPGYDYFSENTQVDACPPEAFIGCPDDLYLHRGILLDAGFPCIFDDLNNTATLSGTNISQSAQTFIRITRSDGTNYFESTEYCLDNDENGAFSQSINWAELGNEGDIFYVFVTAAEYQEVGSNTVCGTFYGWERSISVLIK